MDKNTSPRRKEPDPPVSYRRTGPKFLQLEKIARKAKENEIVEIPFLGPVT